MSNQPTREDYIEAAIAIEAQLEGWAPYTTFERVVHEARVRRAALFREMAERCEK